MMEEMLHVIDDSKTNTREGEDNVTFGPMQVATPATMFFLLGFIRYFWYKQYLLGEGTNVILITVPKKGNNLVLEEKRGIGLASKFTLLLEGILINLWSLDWLELVRDLVCRVVLRRGCCLLI